MERQNPKLAHASLLNYIYAERPKLLAMASSMLVRRQAAERVFNELVIALQDRGDCFSSVRELHTWAWEGLRNRCFNLVARGGVRRALFGEPLCDLLDWELAKRDTGDLTGWSETLRPCLGQLSPAYRWIVQLRYFDGRPGLEVARLTGRNPGAIYADLQRIYVQINDCVRKRAPIGMMLEGPSADREFQRLVLRYLDDELTPEMLERLSDILWRDQKRVQEFNDIRLHVSLLQEFAAQVTSIDQHEIIFPKPAKLRNAKSWAISIAATALVVGGVVGALSRLYHRSGSDVAEMPVAYLSGATAEFIGEKPPTSDGALGAGSYTMKSGVAQLRMASGASVNIEGPAQFEVVSKDQVDLYSGVLTAQVPKQAVGFVVETPVGLVRDLGTEFGVSVNNPNEVDVVVFNGRVEVEQGAQRTELRTGEGLALRQDTARSVISAGGEAYRFPMTVAVSAPERLGDNLILNPSFEIGTLSRAPHTGQCYRDLPSGWEARAFDAKSRRWVPIRALTAGTVVALGRPAGQFADKASLAPVHGSRYAYVDGAALRQVVGKYRADRSYELTVSVGAAQGHGKEGSGSFQFGLWAAGSWLVEQSGRVPEDGQFDHYIAALPPRKNDRFDGETMMVVLMGDGEVFFDDVRLVVKN